MNSEIMVSVICNAYNHEKYIRSALEGFVIQKTDFAFEVLVHDDASTDKTADIIREYEQRYPELIKPIYQTENQYSQGIRIGELFQYPRAKGKYIALCEGDDYWTDPEKLKKQVDALEAHPEIDICAHAAQTTRNEELMSIVAPANKDTVFSIEQVIDGGGGFVATASLMYRKTLRERRYAFAEILTFDYVLQIRGSLRGGMLYLSDCMSVYRLMTESSWTMRMNNQAEKYAKHLKKVEQMLNVLDEETEHRYTNVIQKKISRNEVELLIRTGQYREALSRKHRKGFCALTWKNRIKVCVGAVCPIILRIRQR